MIIVALFVVLFLTEMHELSFITGLVVGMLIIQTSFHRFDKPLASEQSPESGAPPRKIMSDAIQACPKLAWKDITVMTALFTPGRFTRSSAFRVDGSFDLRSRPQPAQ